MKSTRSLITMLDFLPLQDLALLIIGIVTIASAITAIEAQEVIYGAVSLATMFLGIAGLFILLEATYAAMFQISVYLGAIAVLAIFTIMVVPVDRWSKPAKRPVREWLLPAIMNLMLLGILFYVITAPDRVILEPPSWDWTVQELAYAIFSNHGVALVILGLVLAVALMGALAVTSEEEEL